MVTDVRWILLIVGGFGVVLNAVMLARLNRDIRMARAKALLDEERATALLARRRQSTALLVIACCIAVSALFEAGSYEARWLILIAAIAVDWKSYKLFGDRLRADLMVSERLKRERDAQ